MRARNAARAPKGGAPTHIFGVDCYAVWEAQEAVLAFLEKYDPPFAQQVAQVFAPLARFRRDYHGYGRAAVHGELRGQSAALERGVTASACTLVSFMAAMPVVFTAVSTSVVNDVHTPV